MFGQHKLLIGCRYSHKVVDFVQLVLRRLVAFSADESVFQVSQP